MARQLAQTPTEVAVAFAEDLLLSGDAVNEQESVQTTGKSEPQKQSWGHLLSSNARYPHVELDKDEYIIGRHHSCDVKLQGQKISNKHCRIYKIVESGLTSAVLEDLSTYGTFINGKKVGKGSKFHLQHMDQIQFAISVGTLDPQETDVEVAFIFNHPAHEKPQQHEVTTTKRNVHDHYQMLKHLGSGSFASVQLAVDRETGQKYAIKVIDKSKFWDNTQFFKNVEREIGIMMEIKHENLVQIVDFYDSEAELFLVMELMAGGELFDRIVNNGKFSEEQSRRLFRQMLLGVKYLHDRGIVHRDLKPENLLLVDNSDNLSLKISDFGLARVVGEKSFMNTVCGTPNYLAPDVYTKNGYNKAVDMWSLGVILYICLCGFPPFSDDEKDRKKLLDQVKTASFDFPSPWWDGISPLAKNLVSSLICVDPNTRLTVVQALEHTWMQGGSITLEQALAQVPPPKSTDQDGTVTLPPIAVQRPPATKAAKHKRNESELNTDTTTTTKPTSTIADDATFFTETAEKKESSAAPTRRSGRQAARAASASSSSSSIAAAVTTPTASPSKRRAAADAADGSTARKRRK